MTQFFNGACAISSAVIGLFFLRYWRVSADRLFAFFTAAFWLFAAHWVALAVVAPSDEERHWLYLVRLIAFVAIIAGIVDKNRRTP